MSRLPILSRDDAPAASQPLRGAVGRHFGVIPNLFRLVGKSDTLSEKSDAQLAHPATKDWPCQ